MKIPTNFLRMALILGAAALAWSCAPALTPHPPTGLALDADGSCWVNEMMERMTFEDKVAQMIGCRYAGEFYPADGEQAAYLRRLVARHKVGGMVIFGGEAYETALLNNALQSLADVPLLVASDLERGGGDADHRGDAVSYDHGTGRGRF